MIGETETTEESAFMVYNDYFTTRFNQGEMIDAILKVANKNAKLETERDGVCYTMTLLWLINCLRTGASPEAGFREMIKNDAGTGAGAAFWTQVLGANKGIFSIDQDNDADLKLLAGGEMAMRVSCTKKGTGTWHKVEEMSNGNGPYFYLSLGKVQGGKWGHGIGLYRELQLTNAASTPKWAVMDPNRGLATESKEAEGGSLSELFSTMNQTYFPTNGYTLYKITG